MYFLGSVLSALKNGEEGMFLVAPGSCRNFPPLVTEDPAGLKPPFQLSMVIKPSLLVITEEHPITAQFP